MCNQGKEFVHRLELKWIDIVHLMLYDLTIHNAKKYYDVYDDIVPHVNEHWDKLQIPEAVSIYISCIIFFMKITFFFVFKTRILFSKYSL